MNYKNAYEELNKLVIEDTKEQYIRELLNRIDKAIKLIEEIQKFPHTNINQHKDMKELKEILKGDK